MMIPDRIHFEIKLPPGKGQVRSDRNLTSTCSHRLWVSQTEAVIKFSQRAIPSLAKKCCSHSALHRPCRACKKQAACEPTKDAAPTFIRIKSMNCLGNFYLLAFGGLDYFYG